MHLGLKFSSVPLVHSPETSKQLVVQSESRLFRAQVVVDQQQTQPTAVQRAVANRPD